MWVGHVYCGFPLCSWFTHVSHQQFPLLPLCKHPLVRPWFRETERGERGLGVPGIRQAFLGLGVRFLMGEDWCFTLSIPRYETSSLLALDGGVRCVFL